MHRAKQLTIAALLSLASVGCHQSSYSNSTETTAGLTLEPSSREIVVGETVTVVARTHDTYGRDAKVTWSTTAGDLSEEQSGRVARVRFPEVGTYTIKGTLTVDDKQIKTEMVEIRVKPIR